MTPVSIGKWLFRLDFLLQRPIGVSLLLAGAMSILLLEGDGFQVYANSDEAQPALRTIYSRSVAQHYNKRFGADQPFLPSLATTDTGEFIDPKTFPTATYCGRCHLEAHAEWRQSSHSNSFRTPWYTRNVALLKEQKGIEYTRHCEGCHNPIALVSGALTQNSNNVDRKFDEDGITCSVCHSIQKVDSRGTGSYVLAQPTVLVDDKGQPIFGKISDEEILNHLDRHSKAVMKDFYRSSEYCSACHKAALPRQLNDYKWLRAFSVYDEWQQSSYARQSPLPFYSKDSASTCQMCHMQREPLVEADLGAKEGRLASHRWIGANTILARYFGYDIQFDKTVAFLRNNLFDIDIFGIERNGGTLFAPLGIEPITIRAGDTLTAFIVIQNKGIAHSHVPEQRDMYESWVEFEAQDASGRILSHSGGLLANGDLEPKAHSFTNRLVNSAGTVNDLHQVWNNRSIPYNNTIASGRSQIVRYQFLIPANTSGSVTLTVKINYRRFDQRFMDFAMERTHYPMPIVQMATGTRTFAIGKSEIPKSGSEDKQSWMRWNNYGVAMLDAQQYMESIVAFERVALLQPNYPDAHINIALANFQWQHYDDSALHLEKALNLSPHNPRALYYRALVERSQGHLDSAIIDLREVVAKFPRSRDTRRELGFSLFQQKRYDDARLEYESLQAIDPDDLTAHYMLSMIYRRLGMPEKASDEGAMFDDQKNDHSNDAFGLEFLLRHSEIANEAIPWHVHSDSTMQQNLPTLNRARAQ